MRKGKATDNDQLRIQVNVHLNAEEGARVIAYAQASGLSRCGWIRKKIFARRFPKIKQSTVDAFVYRELQKIGFGLNTLIKMSYDKNLTAEFLPMLEQLSIMQKGILKTITK